MKLHALSVADKIAMFSKVDAPTKAPPRPCWADISADDTDERVDTLVSVADILQSEDDCGSACGAPCLAAVAPLRDNTAICFHAGGHAIEVDDELAAPTLACRTAPGRPGPPANPSNPSMDGLPRDFASPTANHATRGSCALVGVRPCVHRWDGRSVNAGTGVPLGHGCQRLGR